MWSSRVRFVDSHFVVLDLAPRSVSTVRMVRRGENTFFCNRTTLVHFFSNSPSYFFRVASSKLGDTVTSSRKAAAVFGAFITPRYAMIALCLAHAVSGLLPMLPLTHSQLFRLPLCQYRTHGASASSCESSVMATIDRGRGFVVDRRGLGRCLD